MGSFCLFLCSDNRIGGDYKWQAHRPPGGMAVTNAAVCFSLVDIGWSFIDGCADALWDEIVVLLCR